MRVTKESSFICMTLGNDVNQPTPHPSGATTHATTQAATHATTQATTRAATPTAHSATSATNHPSTMAKTSPSTSTTAQPTTKATVHPAIDTTPYPTTHATSHSTTGVKMNPATELNVATTKTMAHSTTHATVHPSSHVANSHAATPTTSHPKSVPTSINPSTPGSLHCRDGEYPLSGLPDGTVTECWPCHPACLTCLGPDNGQCVSCPSSLEMDSGYCPVMSTKNPETSPTSSPHTPSPISHPFRLNTGFWMAVFGFLSVAFILIIFACLQAAKHSYLSRGKVAWASSDVDDFEYRKLVDNRDDDENDGHLEELQNGETPLI